MLQRARDIGAPTYNAARVALGLPPATTFAEVTDDVAAAAVLARLYGGDVDAVDLLVGGLGEAPVLNAAEGKAAWQAELGVTFT